MRSKTTRVDAADDWKTPKKCNRLAFLGSLATDHSELFTSPPGRHERTRPFFKGAAADDVAVVADVDGARHHPRLTINRSYLQFYCIIRKSELVCASVCLQIAEA